MFDGAILDVAIGMILLFLVASLIASAIVETIGGFLHRRSKHLWDTLDLLLGNTSSEDGTIESIVDELYRQPFITGLVRPTDRLRFDPVASTTARAPVRPKKLPRRAKARANMKNLPMGASAGDGPSSEDRGVRAKTRDAWRKTPLSGPVNVDESLLRRRFYGPNAIDAREFANSLLRFLGPEGTIDRARRAVAAIDDAMPEESSTDVAIASIERSLKTLGAAADSLGSAAISTAIQQITAAGEGISQADLTAALTDIRSAIGNLLSDELATPEITEMLKAVPSDLRTKLLAVAKDVGTEFADLRSGIEDWYDRNMAAASAWYRKQTRWFLFLAGIVLAASLNVDAVHASTTLYRDESVRDGLVAVAAEVSDIDCATTTTTDVTTTIPSSAPPTTTDAAATTTTDVTTTSLPSADGVADADPDEAEIDLACFRENLGDSLAFPIGWEDVDTSARGWLLRGLGWLFVGVAVTLGAPFWFDLLGRALARRRSTTSS